jgi:hypothetical protein
MQNETPFFMHLGKVGLAEVTYGVLPGLLSAYGISTL